MSQDDQAIDRGDDLLPPDPAPKDPPADNLDDALNQGTDDDAAKGDAGDAEDDAAGDDKGDDGAGSDDAAAKAGQDDKQQRRGKQTANERIQELIRKNKDREAEYQARIKELESNQAMVKVAEDLAEAETKLTDMEEKYAQLLLDGNTKEATRIRQEMRQLERAITQQQTRQESLQVKEAAKEEIRYDATVSNLEATYPQINPDSDDYDTDAVDEILTIHKGLVAQGLPASLSIQRAVKYVLGAPAADDADKGDSFADKGLQRTTDAKKRNVEAAKKQPASTAKVGADSDKLGGGIDSAAVMKMSQEEFSKLSDDALAKMRGDYV